MSVIDLDKKTVVAFQQSFHWCTYLIFCLG